MSDSAIAAELRAVVREELAAALANAAHPHAPAALSTVDETARALSCSRAKLYALVKSGVVPSIKVGDVLRFDVAAVIEALKGASTKAHRADVVGPLSCSRCGVTGGAR